MNIKFWMWCQSHTQSSMILNQHNLERSHDECETSGKLSADMMDLITNIHLLCVLTQINHILCVCVCVCLCRQKALSWVTWRRWWRWRTQFTVSPCYITPAVRWWKITQNPLMSTPRSLPSPALPKYCSTAFYCVPSSSAVLYCSAVKIRFHHCLLKRPFFGERFFGTNIFCFYPFDPYNHFNNKDLDIICFFIEPRRQMR